jgi:hypothetical protein
VVHLRIKLSQHYQHHWNITDLNLITSIYCKSITIRWHQFSWFLQYMHIFRHIFLSNCWWQRSDIWSQASYRYPISWEAFFDSSDSYFLFAEERGYHKWALAHSSSCFKMSTVVYMYCEIIIINHGVLIFVDSVVHLNHKNENANDRWWFISV